MLDTVRQNPASVHPPVEAWIQRSVAADLFRSVGLDFDAEKKKAQAADFRPVALGSATFSLAYRVKHSQIVSKNVAGRIAGSRRPDETVMYAAHSRR